MKSAFSNLMKIAEPFNMRMRAQNVCILGLFCSQSRNCFRVAIKQLLLYLLDADLSPEKKHADLHSGLEEP